MAYESDYVRAQRAIAQRKRTEEITRRQKEQSRELGQQWLRATGRGGGIPGTPGYVAPQLMTPQQGAQNLAALRAARNAPRLYVSPEERTRRGIWDLDAYYQQLAMERTSALSRSFGQQPTLPGFRTPDVRITPQPSPQQIMPTYQPTPTPTMAQPTPIAPTPQPTPTPTISFAPAAPQAQLTYRPAPAQTYQSTYYQTNGYKPYSYQQDTFGDKPFSYAYKPPRLQQSYTGI